MTDSSGQPVGPDISPLNAIFQDGTNLSFEVLSGPSPQGIYLFSASTDPDSLFETYTFAGNGWATNYTLPLTPIFQTTPQAQAAPAGTNVTLSALAFHTTDYQWQMDGTNLVDNNHYSGVTNATLTITNVTRDDTGVYTVIANNPTSPLTSPGAFLFVYKPILLTITPPTWVAPMQLIASNLDGTPFEPDRATNVFFFSTSDVTLPFANWSLSTNPVVLTNGVLEFYLPGDALIQFWRTVEQP